MEQSEQLQFNAQLWRRPCIMKLMEMHSSESLPFSKTSRSLHGKNHCKMLAILRFSLSGKVFICHKSQPICPLPWQTFVSLSFQYESLLYSTGKTSTCYKLAEKPHSPFLPFDEILGSCCVM